MIKKYKKNIKINFVRSKIINQLSYKINNKKFKKSFFKSNEDLEIDIKNTINLFKNIN